MTWTAAALWKANWNGPMVRGQPPLLDAVQVVDATGGTLLMWDENCTDALPKPLWRLLRLPQQGNPSSAAELPAFHAREVESAIRNKETSERMGPEEAPIKNRVAAAALGRAFSEETSIGRNSSRGSGNTIERALESEHFQLMSRLLANSKDELHSPTAALAFIVGKIVAVDIVVQVQA